ncbi:uncharacterized protein LOC111872944 [Cryptotermes secundus]|uniref:uncharacterized protein LOC111872944 n=1 Tax=Cryptotermes secundus TaxID=105785 RepID=UPI000CD7B1C8|nr:uncharacterized protein LOC111872944 [Cryptotermes secundus]
MAKAQRPVTPVMATEQRPVTAKAQRPVTATAQRTVTPGMATAQRPVTTVTATAQRRCEKQERGEQHAVCQKKYMRGNEWRTPAQKYLEEFRKHLRASQET